MIYLWVGAGGVIGTLCRFLVSSAVAGWFGEFFPWGTLLINITGSFAIGFFATLTDSEGTLLVRPEMRACLMVGFCGGYTTFSSFSLQTLRLAQEGQWFNAGANVVASNVGCLLAVWLGHISALALRK